MFIEYGYHKQQAVVHRDTHYVQSNKRNHTWQSVAPFTLFYFNPSMDK